MSHSMKPRVAAVVDGLRQRGVGRDQIKVCCKLAGTEAGLMEALTAGSTAIEDVEMLALAVAFARLVRQLEMSLDQIGGF